jgi:hypothetical protein
MNLFLRILQVIVIACIFIKCLKVYRIGFVLNSLIKPECLICQTRLSGFDSSNSVASLLNFRIVYSAPPPSNIKRLSKGTQETRKDALTA